MEEIYFLSILTVLTVTTILLTSEVCAGNVAESILDYLEHGENLQVGTQKDVVLVLGITSTGKSSLTSLITGAELESIADDEIGGSYHIIDRKSEIMQTSFTLSTKSHSIIESIQTTNLMIDEHNEISFYDCFGFNNARNFKVELAATFALSKLLLFAESVKFLFSVSYDSIKKDNGHDFQGLIRYVNGLIKDIEKYRNAIAMVVTKIPNTFVEMDGQQQLEDDATKIQSLANSLQQYKMEIVQKMSEPTTHDEWKTFKRYLSIIDILLEKDDSGYKRIGIMRLPDRAGLLSEMPLIQSEKANILQIVKENLQYIPKENNDFGYIISDKLKDHIDDIASVLKIKIIREFYKISVHVRVFMLQKEKLSSISLNESIFTTLMLDQNLSQIISMEPNQFLKQISETIDTLGATVPIKHLYKLSKHIFYLDFIQLFSTNNFTIPIEIFHKIAEERDYLNNSQKWYNFLIELRDKLSEYGVQKQKNNYDGSKIMNLVINCEHIDRLVDHLDIKSTIDRIDPQIYEQIQHANAYINLLKLKLLQGIWEQSMQPASKNCSSNGEQLTVHGYNVLISDVIQSVCWPQAKHIEIFALNKVFFDANIEKTAIYLSIISPAWEIVLQGNVTSRQIKLIGTDGINYPAPADNAVDMNDWVLLEENDEFLAEHLNKGKNGLPGVSGGQGGQFFGFAQSVNENRLEILVNGGKGGDGQNGGHGVDGKDGKDVPPKTKYQDLIALGLQCGKPITIHSGKFYTVDHRFCGSPATAGTDGGDGGCKGSGGKSGQVQIFGLTNNANIVSIEENGENGIDGKGGLGGKSAINGQNYHIKIKYHSFNSIFDMPLINPEDSRAMWYDDMGIKLAGKNGTDGKNCYQIGGEIFNFHNPLKSLRQYKYFARSHLNQHVQVYDLAGFLKLLETNPAIK